MPGASYAARLSETLRKQMLTPKARKAADAFYKTFRETGRPVDKKTWELAWERVVEACRSGEPPVKLDGSKEPPPEVSVFGEKE